MRSARLTALCFLSLVALTRCGTSTTGNYAEPDGGGYSGSGSGSGSGSSSGAKSGSGSGSSSGAKSGSGSSSGTTPGADAGVLAPNGCPGGHCLNPSCQVYSATDAGAAPVAAWVNGAGGPETGFDPDPTFIPADVVIPTLDDVPDGPALLDDGGLDPVYGAGNWTKQDLAYLDSNDLHWDFFINTDNWCGPITGDPANDDGDCDSDLMDILTRHTANDHTVFHCYMGDSLPATSTVTSGACTASDVAEGTCVPGGCTSASSTDIPSCADEIQGVVDVVKKMSPVPRPYLTRFRAPYGVPFQPGTDANGTATGPGTAALTEVAPVVAQFAVEVDWNIDSGDSTYNGTDCSVTPCPTATQIASNVMTLLQKPGAAGASHGIILMHGTYPWTAGAIPVLFGAHGTDGEIQTAGFRVGTVEDAICWKYGMHSWDIVNKLNATTTRIPN